MERAWYGRSALLWPLIPFSWLYRLIIGLRRVAYAQDLFHSTRFAVPVVVVGNLTVGGSGKTPLVAWLVDYLGRAGYQPGIVARGYGGHARKWPQQVRPDSDPFAVGDEAVLLARRCGVPIAVAPNRAAAVEALLAHTPCDVVVSDDGLQHYALERDLEVVIIDGVRRFGNGRLLPAGPLREPRARLYEVDLIVANGVPGRGEYGMQLRGDVVRNIHDERVSRGIEYFKGRRLHAVAGIGNPERFFEHLRRYGLDIETHVFPDHHRYTERDLRFDDGEVLMTEKDAVKCKRFAHTNLWYLPVTAHLNEHFGPRLLSLLKERTEHGQEAT